VKVGILNITPDPDPDFDRSFVRARAS
jgi:hypothetical protein